MFIHDIMGGPHHIFYGGAPQNFHTPLLSVFSGYTHKLHVSMRRICRNENSRNSWQQQKHSLFNTLQMFCSSKHLAQRSSVELKTHFNCLNPGLTRIIIISVHLSSLLYVFTWLWSDHRVETVTEVTLCFLSRLFCRSSWMKSEDYGLNLHVTTMVTCSSAWLHINWGKSYFSTICTITVFVDIKN